ncbi:MAG: hypothetical protein M1817_000835 [Caeruleum heppii]|nr:MAG: hypothetical protein M1817_000835 [Caeruleum heppii]
MHSEAPDTRVLINGGGIGGLTLAAILTRLNIPCMVLERSSKITPVGAGISLAPNALRVLDQLGLYADIAKNGQRLNKILIHKEKVKWRALDFTGVQSWFNYPVISIERHEFHHMLYEAAGGEETVRLDSKVEDIIDDPAEPWLTVRVAGGHQYTAEMVVGADGIRSVTRRILARNAGMSATNTIRFTGRVHMSGYTAPIENLGPGDLGVGNWLFYNDSILTTWPCKDNRQWFIGVKRADLAKGETPDRSVWAHATPSMVNDTYGQKFHPFSEDGKFESIVNRSERVIASNVFEEMDFPSMVSGRVALLGDAAHSMTSFFGQVSRVRWFCAKNGEAADKPLLAPQGACQAIEDATELANAIQRCLVYDSSTASTSKKQPLLVYEALNQYSLKREERAKHLVSFSSNYAKLHTANLPYGMGPFLRKFVYAYLPAWMWMWGLQWLYGYQPVVENVRQSFPAEEGGQINLLKTPRKPFLTVI